MSIVYSTHGVIPSIGQSFGPIFSYLSSRIFFAHNCSQILFYTSTKEDFTVSYRDIGSILFCSQGYELFARFALMKLPPRGKKIKEIIFEHFSQDQK